MENSQDRRPDEVARFGNMNINYSQPNELTQDVEISVPHAVRAVRTVPVGPPATAMASTLRTDTSMTKSKESSFQIAESFIDHPILAMLVLGADRTNWFRLHFCTAYRVAALLKNESSLLWTRSTTRSADKAISSLILPQKREHESPHEWHFKIPRSHRSGGLASANTF
jgi:hypothetical protein